jgi:hypothetical protein
MTAANRPVATRQARLHLQEKAPRSADHRIGTAFQARLQVALPLALLAAMLDAPLAAGPSRNVVCTILYIRLIGSPF